MKHERPNIVMIVVDSARFDHVGPCGCPRELTPGLGEFAKEAVNYLNATAPGGSTRPSMASIFTGLYPQAYGFADGKFPDAGHTTFAERLKGQGYHTCLLSNNPYVSPATGMDRGFDVVCYLNRSNMRRAVRPRVVARHCGRILRAALRPRTTYKVFPDMLVAEAIHILRDRRPGSPPILLYIHLDVHHPYLSERRYLRRFLRPGVDEQLIREVERQQHDHPSMTYFAREDLAPDKRESYYSALRCMYDASMFKADEQIQRLCTALKDSDIWDDSAVVVTSDHGECFGEHGMTSHGIFPYEEAIHVPLLVKFPHGTRAACVETRLSSTIDLGPTFCDLAGINYADSTQGISLLDSTRRHEFVINQRWNFKDGYDRFKDKNPRVDWERYALGHVVALKDLQYKYVWTSSGGKYLFDLQADGGESANLAETMREKTEQYDGMLEAWRRGIGIEAGSDEPEYEAAVMEHLRELGYVE